MIQDLRIEDDCLKFKGKKGYYSIDLDMIDMFGKYFSEQMQIIMHNGKKFVEKVNDEEYIGVRDLLLSDQRFLMIDNYAIINLNNLCKWKVSYSHLDFYSLDLKFCQSLAVIGSQEECANMKAMIDEAMKKRIKTYQESCSKHDHNVTSNL